MQNAHGYTRVPNQLKMLQIMFSVLGFECVG